MGLQGFRAADLLGAHSGTSPPSGYIQSTPGSGTSTPLGEGSPRTAYSDSFLLERSLLERSTGLPASSVLVRSSAGVDDNDDDRGREDRAFDPFATFQVPAHPANTPSDIPQDRDGTSHGAKILGLAIASGVSDFAAHELLVASAGSRRSQFELGQLDSSSQFQRPSSSVGSISAGDESLPSENASAMLPSMPRNLQRTAPVSNSSRHCQLQQQHSTSSGRLHPLSSAAERVDSALRAFRRAREPNSDGASSEGE